jgi:hypothetical protein
MCCNIAPLSDTKLSQLCQEASNRTISHCHGRRHNSYPHPHYFRKHTACVPFKEPVGPAVLAPVAVLVLRALHLDVPRILLPALRAHCWGPHGTVQQVNPVKQHHLPHILSLDSHLILYHYLHLRRLTVQAPCLLVGCVPTQLALLMLLLGTLLCLVSPQLAAVTPDLVWVPIHEYRHFCWSSGAWGNGGTFWGMWTDRHGYGECQP